MTSYPFEGKFFPALRKKFREVVFFVHFYEGNRKALLRHIRFVNSLGFDAFAFNLETDFSVLKPPISAYGKWGIKHIYSDQIETLLNQIPGDKIVFSFSNPSASAIEAMARRHCADVKALVCDSGPSAKFIRSVYNLFSEENRISNRALRLAATPLFALLWSPSLHEDLHRDLELFPKDFPILSIRGWKDPLISPDQIDAAFEPHPDLDWRKLSLPQALHLNGLRDFASEYKPAVAAFLMSHATEISAQ